MKPYNKLRELMIKKQKEKKDLKEKYIDTGQHDSIIEKLKEKRDKSDINPDELFN